MRTRHVIPPSRQRLIEQALRRRLQPMHGRERLVQVAFAVAFLVAATALAVLAPAERDLDVPLALALVAAYAVLASAEFSSGAGYLVPTQVLVVPMLLLLPTPLVPLLVAAGTVLTTAVQAVRGQVAGGRVVLAVGDAWFALAPAAVLVALGAQTPALADWPAYLLALLAQFAADAAVSSLRLRWTLGIGAGVALRELRGTWAVDALLAPLGLLVALAADGAPYAALLVVPLAGLFRLAAGEHEGRVQRTIELGRAYRGTALLLHEVVEEDDPYTGRHTQDVVALSARVAEQLRVDDETRQITELGALLHDVGKIAVPKRILHKPAALDAEEWEVMRRHTVEGQRMLERVGGLLAEVGEVVRSSHERWDGGGYPDGLAGPDIPLASRIVTVCDAFNAMTTDRPYRRALPRETALEELRRESGRQFDPEVSDALARIVRPGARTPPA